MRRLTLLLIPFSVLIACGANDSHPDSGAGGGGGLAVADGTGGSCHVDCFRTSRACRDGVVYEVQYSMPCDHGLSVCQTGLPAETCELGCARNGRDCTSASDPESLCGVFDPTGTACGTCVQTVEQFCNPASSCVWTGSLCGVSPAPIQSTWERGCGFVRRSWSGDVSDRGLTIWNEASRELVFRWDNGQLSTGCLPDTRVGIEPQCDEWTDACATTAGDSDTP